MGSEGQCPFRWGALLARFDRFVCEVVSKLTRGTAAVGAVGGESDV